MPRRWPWPVLRLLGAVLRVRQDCGHSLGVQACPRGVGPRIRACVSAAACGLGLPAAVLPVPRPRRPNGRRGYLFACRRCLPSGSRPFSPCAGASGLSARCRCGWMAADNIAEPTIRCGSARITAPRASRGLCHSRTRGLAGGMRESEGGGERAQRAQRRIAAAGGCMAVNEWCGSDSLPTRRGTHWRERDVLCRTTSSACTTGRRSRG